MIPDVLAEAKAVVIGASYASTSTHSNSHGPRWQ